MEIPPRLSKRPRFHGLPIPYTFYISREGIPDFKVMDAEKLLEVILERKCALCSEKLGRHIYFIGGPLSYSHKHFGDPAMHEECARYAMDTCPHLAMGKSYSTAPLASPTHYAIPEASMEVPDKFCLLHCTDYKPVPNGSSIALLAINEIDVEWFTPRLRHAR